MVSNRKPDPIRRLPIRLPLPETLGNRAREAVSKRSGQALPARQRLLPAATFDSGRRDHRQLLQGLTPMLGNIQADLALQDLPAKKPSSEIDRITGRGYGRGINGVILGARRRCMGGGGGRRRIWYSQPSSSIEQGAIFDDAARAVCRTSSENRSQVSRARRRAAHRSARIRAMATSTMRVLVGAAVTAVVLPPHGTPRIVVVG